MFVEIAPRQTGKVKKLVDNAVKYINSHQNTIINLVSYSEDQSNHIKKTILEECKCDKGRIIISSSMCHQKIMGSRVIKNYVFGFDLMVEKVNNTTNLFIDEDAYYITSISTCTDFTKKLLNYFKKTYNRRRKIEDIIGKEE